MTTYWKVGIALAGAYLAVPVLRRMSVGCPALTGKVLPAGTASPAPLEVCKPITLSEMLFWPLGVFAFRK